jgi:hypothetical protein
MDSARAGRSTLRTTGLATRPAARGGRRTAAVAVVAAVVVAASFTPPGRAAITGSFAFLEFFTGVFSLVGLSITVMIGLAATDRLLLLVRHRILLQLVHRATAAIAMVCLAIHVATKLIEGHARVWDPAIPFLADHRPMQVGLGTLAGYLMILAAWTGVTRASYAGTPNPGRWRLLHASAYAAWLLALLHGLGAGRAAKTWVLVSYALCLALVALALLVRFFTALTRRSELARARTRRLRPAGRPAPVADAPPLATSVLISGPSGTGWTGAEPSGSARSPGPAAPVEPGRPAGPPARLGREPAPPKETPARFGREPALPAEPSAPFGREPALPEETPARFGRAGGYRPYRPLRQDRPSSPPPASWNGMEPAREQFPAHPEPPERRVPSPPAVTARRLEDTAEITDEEFWTYIRNEVGR